MANTLAYTTWSEVSGKEMPIDQIRDRLSEYPLPDVLGVLQRMDFLLSKEDRPDGPVQDKIGAGLLGQDRWTKIVGRAVRTREAVPRGQQRPFMWFHQLVLNAAKIAFLACPDGTKRTPPFRRLGEAILGLSDHVSPSWDGVEGERAEDLLRYEITLNAVFNEKERIGSMLPLGRQIYMGRHERLRGHPHWVDLQDLFASATGLAPDRFLGLAMVVWAFLDRQDPARIHETVTTLSLRQVMAGRRVPEREVDAFLLAVARTGAEMRQEVAKVYSSTSLHPFSFVPFSETPLVSIEDRQYCLSYKLFMRRITTDLHFFYLQHLSDGDRAAYLQFHGAAFEDVVHETLTKACRRGRKLARTASITRYRRIDDFEDPDEQRADGIAQFRGVAIVLDAKAGRVPSPAFRSDPERLDAYLDKTLIRAATQIDATIKRLRSGRLRIKGLTRPKRFLPIVVTVQCIGWNAALDRYVARRLREEGLLQEVDVGPLMPVELESLLILADKQPPHFNLVQLIDAWYANDDFRFTALHNFMVALGDRLNWEIPSLTKETRGVFRLAEQVFTRAG